MSSCVLSRLPSLPPACPSPPLLPAASLPTVEVMGRGQLLADRSDGRSWAMLRLASLQEGCHLLEAQHDVFVSAPHAFLVLPDEAAVAELRQLELEQPCRGGDVAELLQRLAAVLQFGRQQQQQQGDAGAEAASPALKRRVEAAAQVRHAACASSLRPHCSALTRLLSGMPSHHDSAYLSLLPALALWVCRIWQPLALSAAGVLC